MSDPEPKKPASTTAGGTPLYAGKTLSYYGIRLSVWLYLKLMNRLRVRGLKNLPKEGGVLLVSNHASFLDIPALAAASPRHVSFLARQSLARSRFLGWVMRVCGAVLVRRGTADRAALHEMTTHLRLGDIVAIFPEGTRSEDGKLARFRGGALFVARRSGVPVVPVGIRGSFKAWPRHKRFPGFARIELCFGEPVDPSAEGAEEELRRRIEALLAGGEVS